MKCNGLHYNDPRISSANRIMKHSSKIKEFDISGYSIFTRRLHFRLGTTKMNFVYFDPVKGHGQCLYLIGAFLFILLLQGLQGSFPELSSNVISL